MICNSTSIFYKHVNLIIKLKLKTCHFVVKDVLTLQKNLSKGAHYSKVTIQGTKQRLLLGTKQRLLYSGNGQPGKTVA